MTSPKSIAPSTRVPDVRALEDRDQVLLVVVAEPHEHALVGTGETDVGELDPLGGALPDQAAHRVLDVRLVGAEGFEPVLADARGVAADEGDPALECGCLGLGGELVLRSAVGRRPPGTACDERDELLAGDVSAHEHGVDLVEVAGADQLGEARGRPVDVRGEEDPHGCTVVMRRGHGSSA